MADQKQQELSDRMLPRAIELMGRSSERLYEVGPELKKKPILREAVEKVAQELDEAAGDFGPKALELGTTREEREWLARQEVAALAKLHVIRLADSPLRKRLIDMGTELEHGFTIHEEGPIKLRFSIGDRPADDDRAPASLSVPCEHIDRLSREVNAAVELAESEAKAPEQKAREIVRLGARIEKLLAVAHQIPADRCAESAPLAISADADVLSDVLFTSVKDEEADSDPWPSWIESVIPTLREAMAAGSES